MRAGQDLDPSYRAKREAKGHRFAPIKFSMSSGIPYLVGFDAGYGHLIGLGLDKVGMATEAKAFLATVQVGGP